MKKPSLTPYLRDRIEDLMTAHGDMLEAMQDGVSEKADEAVERFDAAVGDLIAAARIEGFGKRT